MKTLQEIKDEYAISRGYFSWENLIRTYLLNCSRSYFYQNINEHENNILIIAQKQALQNAGKNLLKSNNLPIDTYRLTTDENNIVK